MLPFHITFKEGIPPCDQLVDAVRKAVVTGEIQNEDAFPSVRQLSRELKISPTTAHKSVAILKGLGLLSSRPGVGMVVNAPQGDGLEDRLDLVRPLAKHLVGEARAVRLSEKELTALIREQFRKRKIIP